ncbi:MAG: Glu-tRNA(Gln) amidotransferase subunit GatD [Candidatus Woesearchaeota archaeon]|nr:Glu-tRNA(Gln) amidotransferase subunit GatD [Candidatus Woesearchaeota archaeon]
MQQGSYISFTYEGNELEGLVIQADEREANIKLSSGYNLVVPVSKVEAVKDLEHETPKHEKPVLEQDASLPNITILHTGGTIASKVDYETGGVDAQFEPEELVAMFPEMLSTANITSKLVANMWSQDMRFAHYNILARAVLEEANGNCSGIIITHGTDFIHYTSAALAFALEDLSVPVVIVGSQRSSDRGSSDANTNLLGALRFINERIPGVFVAMHETSDDDPIAIHDGLHVRKNHSSRRDAFVPVNAPLFGRVKNGAFELLDETRAVALKLNKGKKTRVMPFNEDLKVGIWKAHPQSWVEELKVYDSFDGLIIECGGLGNAPTSPIDAYTNEQHGFIREKIRKLAKQMPVAATVQTIFGRVNLNVYSNQREMKKMGVLGDQCDMHPETAFIKLAWLLSNQKEQVKELYGKNLRGEITPCSTMEAQHTQ